MGFVFGFVKMKRWVGLSSALSLELTLIIYDIGEDSANLLGALLVSTISLAAFSRAEQPESDRRNFFVYLDEFQNFTTLAVANMVSELRKYRAGLVLAHQ